MKQTIEERLQAMYRQGRFDAGMEATPNIYELTGRFIVFLILFPVFAGAFARLGWELLKIIL